MRVAAIDIGSYTTKLAVGGLSDAGTILILGDFSLDNRMTDLLDGEDRLTDEGVEVCLEQLESFRRILRGIGPIDRVRIVGTAGLRRARNQADVIRRIHQTLGLDIEVLPEADESAYVYLSSRDVAPTPDRGVHLVIDVGGGSTELAVGDIDRLIDVTSMPIGAARMARRFLSAPELDPPALLKACEHLEASLDLGEIGRLIGDHPFTVTGCGATMTGLAMLEAGLLQPTRREIHGRHISFATAYEWFETLMHTPAVELEPIPVLAGRRGRVFLGGLAIWIFLLDRLEAPGVIVSDYGVRHGILRELLGLELPLE